MTNSVTNSLCLAKPSIRRTRVVRSASLLSIAIVALLLAAAPRSFAAPEPAENYLQIVVRNYALNSADVPPAIAKALSQPAAATFTGHGATWRATPDGLVETNATAPQKIWTGKDGLPIRAVTGVASGEPGKLWLATARGAILFLPGAPAGERSYYFAGRRYLPDDDVQSIVAAKNHAWIRTRTGIAYIGFEPYSLERKTITFEQRVAARHYRHALVSPCDLLKPGDLASFRMTPDDNDGLWTSIYVAAESFRYASTHSPQALKNAQTSLAAMLRLVSITGIPGFPARSMRQKGEYRSPDGEWHWTTDGQWEWKGDTSSDELVGHFFAYWVAYNLLPDGPQRAQIRATVSSIASGLIEHHDQLIGYGGHVTTWGRYDPEYLKTEDPNEAALDSAELLSHLRVAYAITGDKKFLDAYRHLGLDLGYVKYITQLPAHDPEDNNFSDEELGMLSFYPLVTAETDPALRSQYRAALTTFWQRVRNEKSPLWDYIYAIGVGAKDYDCAGSLDTLERTPLSTINWTVTNSGRDDLVLRPDKDRFGHPQAEQLIPPNERTTMKWNDDPFVLDGGDGGRREDDGAAFLLPYWMGRSKHLLTCSQ